MSRDKILAFALARFTSQGYDAASLAEIAADVGIRKASIYFHFASKKEIFLKLLSSACARELDCMEELGKSRSPAKIALKNYLFQILNRFEENLYLRFWLMAIFLPPVDLKAEITVYDQQFASLLDNTICAKLAKHEEESELVIPSNLLLHAYIGIIRGVHAELLYKGRESAQGIAEGLWAVFESGLATP